MPIEKDNAQAELNWLLAEIKRREDLSEEVREILLVMAKSAFAESKDESGGPSAELTELYNQLRIMAEKRRQAPGYDSWYPNDEMGDLLK